VGLGKLRLLGRGHGRNAELSLSLHRLKLLGRVSLSLVSDHDLLFELSEVKLASDFQRERENEDKDGGRYDPRDGAAPLPDERNYLPALNIQRRLGNYPC